MKLGDIKIEALKMMFVSYGENLTIDNIANYADDENFSSYLVKMNGSINRCFADLERKGIVPERVRTLTEEDGTARGQYSDFYLDTLRMTRLVRVAYENERGVRISNFDAYEYVPEEKRLIARKIGEGECYKITYRPLLERIKETNGDDYEIDLPDTIASMIPFYIKGDLYAEDEPSEASEARNWYEAAMEELMNDAASGGYVNSVYSLANI